MTNYKEIPVFRLNKFIEDQLRLQDIIPESSQYIIDSDSDTDFVIPFISPAGQTPEIKTIFSEGLVTQTNPGFSDLPICTYTWKQNSRSDQPWIRCGLVTYVFYSGDIDKLFEIANYVEDLCGREDRSAYDLNYYFRADSTYPFDFKTINLMSGVGPNPADSEGGLYSYMVNINYDCSYEGIGRTDSYVANNQINIGMW